MSYSFHQVQRTRRNHENNTSTTSNVSNVIDLRTNLKLTTNKGANSSLFTIHVANPGNANANLFQRGDEIVISLAGDGIALTSIMGGFVVDVNQNFDSRGRVLTVTGHDYSDTLLNGLVNQVYEDGVTDLDGLGDTDHNAGKVVKHAITEFAKDTNLVTFDTSNIDVTNPKSNSSFTSSPAKPFDKLIVHQKKLYEFIADMTSDEYTGDGEYIFYVDSSKNAYFKKKPDVFDTSVDEGVDALSMRKSQRKVTVNTMVIYVGTDYNGTARYTENYNYQSILQVGMKWGFFNAGELVKQYMAATTGAPSATELAQAKTHGEKKASITLGTEGSGPRRFNVELKGTASYTIGNIVLLNFPSLDATTEWFRIVEVTHDYGRGGWTTALDLEEDIKGTYRVIT